MEQGLEVAETSTASKSMLSVFERPLEIKEEEDLEGELGGGGGGGVFEIFCFGLTTTTGFLTMVLLAFLAVLGLLALVLPVGAMDMFMLELVEEEMVEERKAKRIGGGGMKLYQIMKNPLI